MNMDAAFEAAEIRKLEAEHSARITVYAPCTCATCEDPRQRWFNCPMIQQRWIAAYDCTPACWDTPSIPCDRSIAWVSEKHPGATLVYYDGKIGR